MSNSQFILLTLLTFAIVAVKSADVYELSNDIRFKSYPSSENEFGNEFQPQDYVLGSWGGNKLKFGGNIHDWSRELRTALRTDLLNNITANSRFTNVQLITGSNPEVFIDVTSVQQCAELCLFLANLTDFGDLSCGGFQYSPTDSTCWPAQGWVIGKEYNDSCKNNTALTESEYCCIEDDCCETLASTAPALLSCVKEYQPRRTSDPEDFAVYIRMFPPTQAPTTRPTQQPTTSPTVSPSTSAPSQVPTSPPSTSHPTQSPTISPSRSPTETTSPTASQTLLPTTSPTSSPTVSPSTSSPSQAPTSSPTFHPTQSPTVSPSRSPTRTYQSPSQSSGSEQSSVVIVLVVVVVILVVGIIGTVIYKHYRRRRRREKALGQRNGQSQPDRGLEFHAVTTSNKGFVGTTSPLATQFVWEDDELPVPSAVVQRGTLDEDGHELPAVPQTGSVQRDIIDGYGTLSDDHVRYATKGDNGALVDADYDVVEVESNKLRVPTVMSAASESDTDYYANDWGL